MKWLSLLVILFIIPLSMAQLTTDTQTLKPQTVKYKSNSQITFDCFYESQAFCAPSVYCYYSIMKPKTNIPLVNNSLSNRGSNYYYIQLNESDTNLPGVYSVVVSCSDNATYNGKQQFYYEVTPTGNTDSSSQSVVSIGLLAILTFLSFGFSILGVYVLGKQNIWFYGAMSLFLGIALCIAVIGMTVSYSRDMAYNLENSTGYERVMTLSINILKYIIYMSIPIFLYLAYEAYKKRKDEFNLTDGWDNNQY